MKEKLDLTSHECKNKIKDIKEQVEHQVSVFSITIISIYV